MISNEPDPSQPLREAQREIGRDDGMLRATGNNAGHNLEEHVRSRDDVLDCMYQMYIKPLG